MKSSPNDTLHFRNGIDRIDVILTYHDAHGQSQSSGNPGSTSGEDHIDIEKDLQENQKRVHEREVFQGNLRSAGLNLELEKSEVRLRCLV